MDFFCVSDFNERENETNQMILFREKEINFIKRYMGPPSSFPYPSLLVYGHTTTGKTLVVSKVMKGANVPYVWINCHEFCSAQSLFIRIVRNLDFEMSDKKIGNMHEFLNFLRIKLKETFETTYLIFDCAEMLRNEDPYLLSVLSKLQMLTKVNISTIFISELPWRAFRSPVNSFDPISLHFESYSKDQIAEILTIDCPPGHTEVFYKSYVNVIMKTFFILTTNISELRHLAEINFEKYCEPLKEDTDVKLGCFRLWKNIEPTLKEAMGSVYLREISSSKWKAHCSSKEEDSENKCSIILSNKFSATRELPFYSKFLLLAAYFASYNPSKSDFKHFVKNQGKQAKKRISKRVEKNRHLLGPKPFTLDRMLSIFFSIVGEKVLPSSLIFSQISSLVNMRLMSRVSTDEHLDCPKYKCLAELDLVSKIGKTVSIDVMGYLDDFL